MSIAGKTSGSAHIQGILRREFAYNTVAYYIISILAIRAAIGHPQASHKAVKHALAEMLLQRPIGQLLESSTLVNPALTGFFASFRSGPSCRTDLSAETVDARALDTMHRASLLTSILGRMSNEKLNYAIQAAIGATFLAKGVGILASSTSSQ
jgi:hypothetical protein